MSVNQRDVNKLCHDFYYRWLLWEEFSDQEKSDFWRTNKHLMECGSLGEERYIHHTNAVQGNANINAVKESLLKSWNVDFARLNSGHSVAFEQLKAFRAQSQEQIKNRLNYLPCNWIYSGTTRAIQGELNDAPVTKAAVSIQWDLHYIVEGTGVYCGKNYQLEAPAGSLVLIPPSESLSYFRSPNTPRWTHRWVAFQLNKLPSELNSAIPNTGALKHVLLGQQARSAVNAILDDINRLGKNDSSNEDQQRQLLDDLFRLALMEARDETNLDGKLVQACQYIGANLAQNLSVNDIASVCNLSATRFSHIFKDKLGVSPIMWRNEYRLAKACSLLSQSQLTIGEVAQAIGYDDQMYFSKLFKKRLGYSPSGYRAIQCNLF
ncbi:helix-turn-helix domain-containing protein [Halioxenophilus aromaticivorans]|uniref:HTH araC/xylS-type domain-containing protein n=1 Tax=Halioxenophilus aromaticivorans TaxID=1306992 RepID=A0AAV3U3A1_9ALTE